jgi:hypothetical protein
MRGLFALAAIVMTGGHAAGAAAAEPLRLELRCVDASAQRFRMTIRNVGSEPTAVVIGSILGNDRTYVAGPLRFMLQRPGAGDDSGVQRSADRGRGRPRGSVAHPAAGGRVLRGNAVSAGGASRSAPAAIQVRLGTHEAGRPNSEMQGVTFIHLWVGALESGPIQFPDACIR